MPSPNTIGGGLMGYPATVDTGQTTPFALYTGDITVLAASALTAGSAYFTGYVLLAPVTLAQMRCQFSGSPTGNVDMGIYDATGTNEAPNNLLGHTGAIAAVTGVFTQNLTANLLLPSGKYWLAWLDTVADSIFNRSSSGTGMGELMRTSATNLTVLPATAGTVIDTGSRVGIEVLRLGGWS